MKKIATLFLLFVTCLAILVSLNGFLTKPTMPSQIFQILFVPITVYLFISLAYHLTLRQPIFETQSNWVKLLVLYCFTISLVFVIGGFMSSNTQADFITTLVFVPLPVYFLLIILPQRKLAIITAPSQAAYEPPTLDKKLDVDRRDFLKIIGTAGISIFLYNLLFKRDVGSFLGNFSPSTDPLALKNAQGEVINPAEKSPTQGYSISQIDDSATSYFGFINSLGQWFIMRQDTDNSYRYSRGDNDFTSNWSDRAKLSYDYFDNVF